MLNAIVRLALNDLNVTLATEAVDFTKAVTVLTPMQIGQIFDRLILQWMVTLVALVLILAHVLLIVSYILIIRKYLFSTIYRFATLLGFTLESHCGKPRFQLSQPSILDSIFLLVSDCLEWRHAR